MADLFSPGEKITFRDKEACVRRELEERRKVLRLPLRHGLELIIEERDVWIFSTQHWNVRREKNTAYLYRRVGSDPHRVGTFIHREVMAAPPGLFVDHINGNGLDNRRSNLRLVTRTQNVWNQAAKRRPASGYFGVAFHPQSGLWMARINTNKKVRASYHKTPEEAARARDAMAIEDRGEFACLNFPKADAEREIEVMEAILGDYVKASALEMSGRERGR
jgi:hypothetical protein